MKYEWINGKIEITFYSGQVFYLEGDILNDIREIVVRTENDTYIIPKSKFMHCRIKEGANDDKIYI